MTSLATLDARVRSAVLRLRLQRAVDAFVVVAAGCLALVAVALGVAWLLRAPLPAPTAAWLALVGVPVAAGLGAALRRVPALPIVVAFDRSHGLPDLLSSAWAFAQLPAAGRSAFMQATLARAERTAATVEVARSQPFRRPRGLGYFGVALASALALGLGLPPQPSAASAPVADAAAAPSALERLLSNEQLAAFRRRLALLDSELPSVPEAASLRAELERLLDELGAGPADRLQVLRRLGALEARARVLAANRGTDRAAAERSAAERSDEPATALSESPAANAEPPPTERADEPAPPEREPPAQQQPQARGPDLPDSTGSGADDPPGSSAGDPPAPQQRSARGPTPQPSAAAPSNAANDGAPRGPELERNEPGSRERGEALSEAISELRDLINRNEQLPGDPNDPAGTPRAPRRPKDDAPDRDDSRADRTGAPNAAYASSGPPPQSNGEGAGEDSQDLALPPEATRVTGASAGGPIRSQVIYGAAERGFSGRDYARVHGEYERHAERELAREEIPPGFRGYVRRYFQSIAPRPSP